jgi:hypothetical protein
MKINPLTDLLSDPTRGTDKSNNVLCYLFRKALLWGRYNKHPVDFTGWNSRAKDFFEKPHNAKYKKDKGNLNKELTRPEFTWPTFKKAVDFLNPISATLTIEITRLDNTVSKHVMVIDPAEDESAVDTFGEPIDVEGTPFEGKKKPANSLARFWRSIVIAEGITTTEKWNEKLDRYVRSPLNDMDITSLSINDAKNTINRQLMDNTLSWGKFRMGLNFLDYRELKFILECRWGHDPDDFNVYESGFSNPLYKLPKRNNGLKKAR